MLVNPNTSEIARASGVLAQSVRIACSPKVVVAAGLICAGVAQAQVFPPTPFLGNLAPQNGGDGTDGTVITANRNSGDLAYFGLSIAKLGDINGDDIDDVGIGAPSGRFFDADYGPGRTYVIFGQEGGLGAAFEAVEEIRLGDGSQGFVVNGFLAEDRAGFVAGPGDLNDDGLNDVVIGSPGSNQVFIVFGSEQPYPSNIELEDLLPDNGGDGSVGVVLTGGMNGDQTGIAVASGCDANGDGLDDLLIGAAAADPEDQSDAGVAYLVFGRSDGFAVESLLLALTPPLGGDGSDGVVFKGVNAEDRTGVDVACVGDVNGDGVDDMLFGASGVDVGAAINAGAGYLVFGRDTPFAPVLELSSLLQANGGDGSDGVVVHGEAGHFQGQDLAGLGDFNGDGFEDIAIQSNDRTFVVLGQQSFPPELRLNDLRPPANGEQGFELTANSGIRFLAGLAGAGDINTDGFADLVIGTTDIPRRSFLLYGTDQPLGASIELSALALGDGTVGVTFQGAGGSTGTTSGTNSIAGVGDLNDDGLDDLLISVYSNTTYLVHGRAGDSDEDGINDAVDNCLDLANADQRDGDGDGFGNVCDGDLDNDCDTDFDDLAIMKSNFFGTDPSSDLDGNGNVDFDDLAIMRTLIFAAPGPSGASEICEE